MLSQAGHAVRASTRTCVGCRERSERSVLLRVVAAEVDGVWCVVPDPHHRQPGRGASLHPRSSCLELAERRRAFTRALRRADALSPVPLREYVAALSKDQAPPTPEPSS